MRGARVGGEGLALGVVGALALAAAAASRLSRARGSANLSAARRRDFDALAEAYRDYASQFDFASILDIHRFAQANGLTFLGDGWSRAVFSVPEGALKIAKSRQMSLGGQFSVR